MGGWRGVEGRGGGGEYIHFESYIRLRQTERPAAILVPYFRDRVCRMSS